MAPVLEAALTTGVATSTVLNVMQNERSPSEYPDPDTTISLSGQPFNCATWGQQTAPSASVVIPAFALDYVKRHAGTPEAQQAVLEALEFKCDVLWAMLDALYHAYVAPKYVPPGAFVPKD